MEFCHLELESGCNEEVAALLSDHYTGLTVLS